MVFAGFDSGVEGGRSGTRASGRVSDWTSSGIGVADEFGRLNSKSSSQFSVASARNLNGEQQGEMYASYLAEQGEELVRSLRGMMLKA